MGLNAWLVAWCYTCPQHNFIADFVCKSSIFRASIFPGSMQKSIIGTDVFKYMGQQWISPPQADGILKNHNKVKEPEFDFWLLFQCTFGLKSFAWFMFYLKNFFLPMPARLINTMPSRSMVNGSGLGWGEPKEATLSEKARGATSRINKKIHKRKIKRFIVHLINYKWF